MDRKKQKPVCSLHSQLARSNPASAQEPYRSTKSCAYASQSSWDSLRVSSLCCAPKATGSTEHSWEKQSAQHDASSVPLAQRGQVPPRCWNTGSTSSIPVQQSQPSPRGAQSGTLQMYTQLLCCWKHLVLVSDCKPKCDTVPYAAKTNSRQ